jgi:hypothetical protein
MKEFFGFFRLEKVFENIHSPGSQYSASSSMVLYNLNRFNEDFTF